jgi:hypothetical protein
MVIPRVNRRGGGKQTVTYVDAKGYSHAAIVTGGVGAVDEVESLAQTGATGGTFTLTFRGQTTTAIARNAAAATVQSALEALSTIGVGQVSCGGGALGTAPVTVEFTGTLAGTDVSQITVDGTSLTPLATATVATTTPGDGTHNEVQSVTIAGANGGTFTLTFSGQTTAAIAWNASAATVQSALEALSNVGAGQVSCTGGPLNTAAVSVEFTGTLALTNVAQMTSTATGLTKTARVTPSTTTEGSYSTSLNLRVPHITAASRNKTGILRRTAITDTNVWF